MDKIASIYANALVDLAQSKNVLETVHADVDSLQARSWQLACCDAACLTYSCCQVAVSSCCFDILH